MSVALENTTRADLRVELGERSYDKLADTVVVRSQADRTPSLNNQTGDPHVEEQERWQA